MPFTIVVGSYTNVIKTLSFDPSSPLLQVIGTSPAGSNPSWVASHPSNKSLLFACNEQSDGRVSMYKLKDDGKLELLQSAWSGGRDPAHFVVGENEVVVANYSSGTLCTLPLVGIDGPKPQLLAPTHEPVVFKHPGVGPVADRQEASHPHQVGGDVAGSELLIPDLGSDTVWRLGRNETSWKIQGAIEVTKGKGPRHLIVADETLYVLNELESTLSAFSYGEDATCAELSTASMLKTGKPAEGMLGAELLYTPASKTYPQALLYASNRNDPHAEGDSIGIFSTRADGFKLVGEVRTGLNHLRAVAFGGEDDRYLVVGGLNGGGIKVFERVDEGRGLKEVAHLAEEIKPTSFVIL